MGKAVLVTMCPECDSDAYAMHFDLSHEVPQVFIWDSLEFTCDNDECGATVYATIDFHTSKDF